MNKFFTWLFDNIEYNKIQLLYNEATNDLKTAYLLWCNDNQEENSTKWNHKRRVAADFDTIKSLYDDINTSRKLQKKYNAGLHFILTDKHLPKIEDSSYYKTVARLESQIVYFHNIILTFQQHQRVWMLFGDGSLETANRSDLEKAYKNLLDNGAEASKISKAIELSESYPLSWKTFISEFGDGFPKDAVNKAFDIPQESWLKKEEFLAKTVDRQTQVNIILANREYNPSSFDSETLELERSVLSELEIDYLDYPIEFDCTLHDKKELNRLVLDYSEYARLVDFSDDITIPKLYSYRALIDETGCRFSDLVGRTTANRKGIIEYKKANGLEETVSIEDYILMGKNESALYKYVAQFKEKEKLRDKIKSIKRAYNLGFCSLFGDVDIDLISVDDLNDIYGKLEEVEQEDQRLIARKRLIEEEKRREEEARRLRQEQIDRIAAINSLNKCVSTWYTPNRSSLKCFSLYYYYPTSCDWFASQDEWDIRTLIWNFKANPNKPIPMNMVIKLHEESVAILMPNIIRCLQHFFGRYLDKLTLVCLPSSKRDVTERRYKDFSAILTAKTGMINAYDHIRVTREGGAKHLGESGAPVFEIDSFFFKNKYILLFDDVITTGSSMDNLASLLSSVGAVVIGGMSIGRTRHTRELRNPIDDIPSY